jgi:hypothetical protein
LEIGPEDRFECKVIDVIDNLRWKGITVQESVTGGIVYFARVSPDENIGTDDTFYLQIRELPHELDEMGAEIRLVDENGRIIDWTYISRGLVPPSDVNPDEFY